MKTHPCSVTSVGRRVVPGRAALWITLTALAGLAGCSHEAVRPVVAPVRTEGSVNPPVIISSNPRRDAAAFRQADEELSPADWEVLEQLGPRPVWEKLATKRSRAGKPAAATTAGPAASPPAVAPADAGADADGPGCPDGTTLVTIGPGPAPAAATPAAAVPTTGPSTRPTTQPTVVVGGPTQPPAPHVDESDLPLQVIELPDNKVRLIWVLRSFGGSTVASSRDATTSRRTVALTPPDLAPLVAALTPALGAGGSVVPIPKDNTLVVTCDKTLRPSVVDLLARLDVPQRQVEITAKIFEVTSDFDFQQGTEMMVKRLGDSSGQALISTFSAKRFADAAAAGTDGGKQAVQGSVLRLLQNFSAAGVSLDVSFQLLAEAGMIRVVSSPRMTVAVGQTGYMLAGQEMPIQSAFFVNNALQTTVNYKPVGVQLYITPQAAGADRVKLHTISIVSSVSGFNPLPAMDGSSRDIKDTLNPVIDSREAETAITVGDGDTLVISGLRMVRTTTREDKIPGLGDVPALGWLFKSQRNQQQMTDLYFFLTPKLL